MASILILTEQREGKLHPQSIETVAAGQALAAQNGSDVVIAVFGTALAELRVLARSQRT